MESGAADGGRGGPQTCPRGPQAIASAKCPPATAFPSPKVLVLYCLMDGPQLFPSGWWVQWWCRSASTRKAIRGRRWSDHLLARFSPEDMPSILRTSFPHPSGSGPPELALHHPRMYHDRYRRKISVQPGVSRPLWALPGDQAWPSIVATGPTCPSCPASLAAWRKLWDMLCLWPDLPDTRTANYRD